MNPDVTQLFHLLADLSPEQRARYLSDHPVDPLQLREVEELLAHDTASGDLFSHAVGSMVEAWLSRDPRGARCGPFRLVSVIGHGGMGVVYLAERADGEVKQRAAVKLMRPGWGEVHRERFLREREILAALKHPNIAHLLDAGHLSDGQPYLAMEYVEGKPIHEYCRGLSVRQKIELFLKVCGAVAYLHANSVVHRDLKPSNILIPALGEPKLLDFGISKMLDPEGDATVTQLRMLTPDYASPEQMSGGVVGPGSDIYSLGVILHQLLTGQSPGQKRPSELAPELKGDLEVVLQTAMRHEPQERYRTVEEFASDLKACFDSRPIRARRGGWVYRTRKFVRRYWLTVSLAGALAAALVGVGGLVWYRSQSGSAVKDLRPRRLTANTPELPIEAAAISPDGKSIAYSDPLGIHLYSTESGDTRLLPGTSGHVLVQWAPGASNLETQVPDQTGGMTAMLVSPAGGSPVPAQAPGISKFSPDRQHRATVLPDPQRLLVQGPNGERSRELWRAGDRGLDAFEWSPDVKQIAVLSSNRNGSVLETIDTVTGRKNIVLPAEKQLSINSLLWPRQDRMIVAVREAASGVNSEGSSNLWELRLNAEGILRSGGLRRLTAWTDFPIRSGSLSTDGKRTVFVRSFRQRDVYVAEIDPSRLRIGTPHRLTLHLGDDYPTAWTRDSKTVIFSSDRNGPSAIFLQDVNEPTARQLVAGPQSQILPRLAPDGNSILFYVGRTGKLMRIPVEGGAAEPVMDVSNLANYRCAADGPCMIAERNDGTTVVFELDPAKGKGREIYRETTDRYATPDISPDGKFLATALGTKIVVRSFSTGAVVREIAARGLAEFANLVSLDYAPDGRGFFAGDSSPTEARQLYIDFTGRASVLWRQAGSSPIWGVPSPDGRYLAMMVYTDDSNVYIIDDL